MNAWKPREIYTKGDFGAAASMALRIGNIYAFTWPQIAPDGCISGADVDTVNFMIRLCIEPGRDTRPSRPVGMTIADIGSRTKEDDLCEAVCYRPNWYSGWSERHGLRTAPPAGSKYKRNWQDLGR